AVQITARPGRMVAPRRRSTSLFRSQAVPKRGSRARILAGYMHRLNRPQPPRGRPLGGSGRWAARWVGGACCRGGIGGECSMAVCWRLAERLGWSALALPEPAVFDPVAAGGHVAPGACPAVGAVVEGPPAVGVAAGLQPVPGAVALCVAD